MVNQKTRLCSFVLTNFFLFFLLISPSTPVSVPLQPFQSTPHIKLCNIQKQCQDLLLVIDTGSPDLWISDSSCAACPKRTINCLGDQSGSRAQKQKPFPASSLTSSQNNNQGYKVGGSAAANKKQIQYGVGWVRGLQVNYKLCGIQTELLCVTEARDIGAFSTHGVIGLGGNGTGKSFLMKLFNYLNVSTTISLFYGTYFTELTLGGYNQEYTKVGSSLTYFHATPDWTLNIDSIFAGNKQISDQILGLIDTGSSLLVFPSKTYNKLFSAFQDVLKSVCQQQTYGIECSCDSPNDISLLPSLFITLTNDTTHQYARIAPEGNIQQQKASEPEPQQRKEQYKGNPTLYELSPRFYVRYSRQKCIAEVASLPLFENVVILGNPFLRQYMTVYDLENHTLGIVEGDKDRIKTAEIINLLIVSAALLTMIVSMTKLFLHVAKKYFNRQVGRLII